MSRPNVGYSHARGRRGIRDVASVENTVAAERARLPKIRQERGVAAPTGMRIVELHFHGLPPQAGRLTRRQLRLLVQMPDPDRCTTQHHPDLASGVLRLLPDLVHHDCENGAGHAFAAELVNTEVPHLLEHVILELQALAQHHDTLRGETEWNWRIDPRGSFHVHVEYENEQLALASARLAERLLNALQDPQEYTLDLDFEIDRLRRLAELGQDLRGAAQPAPPLPDLAHTSKPLVAAR